MERQEDIFEEICKIVIVGETLVGKTCFLSTYIPKKHTNTLKNEYNDFEAKTVCLKSGKKVNVQVWDISGKEEFRDIANLYYKGALGALILYDITNINTFCTAKDWVSELKTAINCTNMALIGTKIDLCLRFPQLRKVAKLEAQEYAEKKNIFFTEISTFEPKDVSGVFELLLEKINLYVHSQEIPQDKILYFDINSILFVLAIVIAIVLIIYDKIYLG
jgi:small GTP-binding protein